MRITTLFKLTIQEEVVYEWSGSEIKYEVQIFDSFIRLTVIDNDLLSTIFTVSNSNLVLLEESERTLELKLKHK